MLVEDHIFTVKTKDPANVADVAQGGSGIVITGLNVLREQIEIGDFVFVVFGGDKPKGWTPGLVALAHVSRKPYVGDGDEGRNFRIEIDVDLFFQPSVKRGDLISYPDTFDTIGIGPITKWEPNQALTSVMRVNAIGLLQALCDIFPANKAKIKSLLGNDFALLEKPVRRFTETTSVVGKPDQKQDENALTSEDCLAIAVREFKAHRVDSDWSKTDCPASQMMAYQAVNTGIREYFGKLSVAKVAAFGLGELTELFTGVKGPDGKVVFEPMWSGKIGQGWPHIQKAFKADEQKVVAFLVGLATSSASLSSFASPGFERPGGFGGSVISELLMKFHPTEAFKYGGKTADALKVVGLQDYEPHPANFKQDEYDHVLGLAKKIKETLAKAGVTRCLDDVEQPDFLTVNEFLDWVYGHQQLLADSFAAAEADEDVPPTADRLTIALRLFKRMRHEEAWQKNVIRDSYLHIFNFVQLTAEAIAAMPVETFKTDVMDKVWAFQNGGARSWRRLEDGEKVAYQKFVADLRGGLKPFEAYFPPDKKCPRGMGVGVVSELLMRFYPTVGCSYNKDLIWDALVTLGLAGGAARGGARALPGGGGADGVGGAGGGGGGGGGGRGGGGRASPPYRVGWRCCRGDRMGSSLGLGRRGCIGSSWACVR